MNVTVLRKTSDRRAVAFVNSEGTTTRVRFKSSTTEDQWRCDSCGPQRFATCPHARAAISGVRKALTERNAR